MKITEETRFCVCGETFATREEAQRFLDKKTVESVIGGSLYDIDDPHGWLKESLEQIAWSDGGDGGTIRRLIESLDPPNGKARMIVFWEGEP